ncbi:uncharacterized protein LOC134318694 [Trichomycterus rosablanca]|uniref:uncharacterized protein LOC134318694 n=1 Tax=Trichomycterus rosablanca TaxID=2290929 RepID=UPI002F3530F6
MAVLMWTVLVLLTEIVNTEHTNKVNQPDRLITATSGANVTLHCFLMEQETSDPVVWYKQIVGHEPHVIAKVYKILQDPIYEEEFKPSRFTFEKEREGCHLKIANVVPSDEAIYYCGLKTFTIMFGKGTFLSVKGNADVSVSVLQNAMLDSVAAGESVNLQCNVLSESRTAEPQVLWFRSAAPQSLPQITYTQHNSSHQCKNSSSTYTCVYNFSKSILTISDTGTYYCAVFMCGKIIFGNGTTVHLKGSVDPVVICLALAVAVCVIVIAVQAVSAKKKGKQCQETITVTEKTSDQGHNAAGMNYAALHFSKAKNKSQRVNQRKDTVYSEDKHSTTP